MTLGSFSGKVLEVLAYSNVWIALGAVSLSLYATVILGWELNYRLLSMIFFATLSSYNFQRVIRLKSHKVLENHRHVWIVSQKKILYFLILLSSVISAWLFLSLYSWVDLIYVSPLILVSGLYAFKFKEEGKALRDVPYIKIILIALCWVSVTVLLPAYMNDSFTKEVWQLSLITLLYIVGITIPFDIRDLHYDEVDKKTIPQMLGVKGGILVSEVLIFLAACMYLYWFRENWIMVCVYLISMIVVAFTNENRKELFYVIVIDGLLLLFPLFLLLLQ